MVTNTPVQFLLDSFLGVCLLIVNLKCVEGILGCKKYTSESFENFANQNVFDKNFEKQSKLCESRTS